MPLEPGVPMEPFVKEELLRFAAVHRVATRRVAFAEVATRTVPIALAVAFGAALLARRVFAADALLLAACFATLVPALWIAAVRARLRTPSVERCVATLDRATGGSGRLLTRNEIDDPRFDSAIAHALEHLPRPPSIDWKTAAMRIAPWAIVAALPFWLAPATLRGPSSTHPAIERSIARLAEKLATLEEEIALERTADSGLHEQLDRVRDSARDAVTGADLDPALEALDRMDRELDAAAERAAQAMEQAADGAAAANQASDPSAAANEIEQVAADLERAGLSDALEAARNDLAQLRERNERDGTTPETGAGEPQNASESQDAGEESGASSSSTAAGESGAAGSTGSAGDSGALASKALAKALANRLAAKADRLQRAGMLPRLDPRLVEKLAELAGEPKEGEATELAEIASIEELDLCDEETHGPG